MLSISSMLEHMLISSSSMLEHMLLSISSMLRRMRRMRIRMRRMRIRLRMRTLRTAVQQCRKRIRQRRKRRALQRRQRQQQPVKRCKKLRCAGQSRRNARGVVGEDVERDRRQHRRTRYARRQALAALILERRERQRQIRQLDPNRRQPAREVAARRGERALDAQRARGAQQQHRKGCENTKSHTLLPLLSQHIIEIKEEDVL
jgi:hypothetical protein